MHATDGTKFQETITEIQIKSKTYTEMTLSDALSKTCKNEKFLFQCKLTIIDVDPSGIYKACVAPRCAKKLDYSEGVGYQCSKCGMISDQYLENVKLKVSVIEFV